MYQTILLFGLILAASSCGSSSKKTNESPLKKVRILALVHKPYCGGAKPTPEIAKGLDEALANTSFTVYKGSDLGNGTEAVLKFNTDEQGEVSFELEKGTYAVYANEKLMSTEALKAKFDFKDPRNYVFRDDKCFAMWKKTPNFTFQLTSDTLIRYMQNAKCWIGTVPCVDYVGKPAQ